MLFRGRPVRAWAGPYQGTKLIDGAAWFPYQPATSPTPPFPEYSSGHEVRRHWGEILRLSGSIYTSQVSRYDVVRAPQRDGRPTALGEAIATYGRLFKTLHFLSIMARTRPAPPGTDVLLDAALKAATGLQQLLAQPHAAAAGVPRANGIPASSRSARAEQRFVQRRR
jgi:hypothetical protein